MNSPYATIIILVKRKDCKNILCVDYRQINPITVVDTAHPLNPEHIFLLHLDQYLRKIDHYKRLLAGEKVYSFCHCNCFVLFFK